MLREKMCVHNKMIQQQIRRKKQINSTKNLNEDKQMDNKQTKTSINNKKQNDNKKVESNGFHYSEIIKQNLARIYVHAYKVTYKY